jgi:hypothetical protein
MPKAQSAMEYLTSYGWMVIVVAIVILVMFRLGLFNATNFEARLATGSCMVYRPNGPGSITFIDLVGLCTNGIPRSVGMFRYYGPFSMVGYSNLTIPKVKYEPSITNSNNNKITITGWIYPATPEPVETAFAYGDFSPLVPPFNGIYIDYNQSGICNNGLFEALYTTALCIYSSNIALNQWHFVAVEYDGTNAIGYIISAGNVVSASGHVNPFYIASNDQLLISVPWNGLITNIQMYNTSLSRNQIVAVYKAGIGGPPTVLKNLVGWWPLNGDIKDYSGNGNNGYPTNGEFNGGLWYSNYTVP